MRQIPYNNSAATIRLEYPPNWDIAAITGVTITVNTTEATELLAATAATLYTATTLDAAAAVGDAYIPLAAGASAVNPGDVLQVTASSSGPAEVVVCRYYDSSNRYVYTQRDLRHAHASGAAVRGAWCTYDLDTSDTDDYPKSEQLVLIWTPGGSDDIAVHERAEIASMIFAAPDFEERFRTRYEREYKIAKMRDDGIARLAKESYLTLKHRVHDSGIRIDRMPDTDAVMDAILNMARHIIVSSGGNDWAHEQDIAAREMNASIERLCNPPRWVDADQDGSEDADEVDDYSAGQYVGSENSI